MKGVRRGVGSEFGCKFGDDGCQAGEGSAGSGNITLIRDHRGATTEVVDIKTLFGVVDVSVLEGVIRPAICRNAYGLQ
jgi:hypothetical protein